jgi:hypothetical protein
LKNQRKELLMATAEGKKGLAEAEETIYGMQQDLE